MSDVKRVRIIGGGLAGCECALQLLAQGIAVEMFEMRPAVETGAHQTQGLAELVCSNSLKSEDIYTASGLLKEELKLFGCKLLGIAGKCRVPSGSALSVDREKFSEMTERALESYDNFTLIRQEVTELDENIPTIIATGPLTSPKMAEVVGRLSGKERLFFYDAIAPIVSADSIDYEKAYFGGRYGKGGDDYLNLPMQKDEYELFYTELVNAKTVVLHDFEKKELFEGCMPIEEMAKRGSDTIRFGPLRPVGLRNPKTGESAYAVVQLRRENVAGDCFNLVGFQTNLTYPEQKRVFSLIPALSNAEFLRYGVMHRNTYINSPDVLDGTFRVKASKIPLYIAGQLSGVEGYVESIMSGMIAGQAMAAELLGFGYDIPSPYTITGSLLRYVSECREDFKPMNANFGILPPLVEKHKKGDRKKLYHDRSISTIPMPLTNGDSGQ